MVTLPAVGNGPIARNSVTRFRTLRPFKLKGAVLTVTQFRPFPESDGSPAFVPSVLTIHARMSRFAPGAIDVVVADWIFGEAVPPPSRTVALIAACGVEKRATI